MFIVCLTFHLFLLFDLQKFIQLFYTNSDANSNGLIQIRFFVSLNCFSFLL